MSLAGELDRGLWWPKSPHPLGTRDLRKVVVYLVGQVVRLYPWLDRAEVGTVALTEAFLACEKFDAGRGAKLTSYVYQRVRFALINFARWSGGYKWRSRRGEWFRPPIVAWGRLCLSVAADVAGAERLKLAIHDVRRAKGLTRREAGVLVRMLAGERAPEIARRFGVHPSAINVSKRRGLAKLCGGTVAAGRSLETGR